AGSANDVISAFAAMREGPDRVNASEARQGEIAHRVRTIVFHGDRDPTGHSSNGDRIVEDGVGAWGGGQWEAEQGNTAGGRTLSRRTRPYGAGPGVAHWG